MGCHEGGWSLQLAIACCCLLFLGNFQATHQLTIKSVDIPAAVKVGDGSVILDCDYDLQNTSSRGLVVKWYLNDFDLVYQWIYDREPQASERSEKYIDLRYRASNDPTTMYRAMKLREPDIHLTGDYTCLISTFEDEVSAKQSMTVYTTGQEDEFKLWYSKMNYEGDDGDDEIEVTCQALGLYPKPSLEISVEGSPDITSPRPIITETKDGHYNIVSYLTLENDDLPDSVVINCVLGIPDVDYNATKKIVHYPPGRPTTDGTAVYAGGTTKLLRKMEIHSLDSSQADASSGAGNMASYQSAGLLVGLSSIAAYTLLGY